MAADQDQAIFLPRFGALSGELIIDLIIPVTIEPTGQRYIAIHELDPGVIYLKMHSTDASNPWRAHRPVSLFDYDFTNEKLEVADSLYQSYESGRSLVVYRSYRRVGARGRRHCD